MNELALALVLSSAVAHAVWNYLAKSADDAYAFTWSFSVLATVLTVPIALVVTRSQPLTPLAGYLIGGTIVIHLFYFRLLTASYSKADLSMVYPVARGIGLLLVPLGAATLLGESISRQAVLSIGIIFIGVLSIHLRGTGLAALAGLMRSLRQPGSGLAALTGLSIAAYSLWDKNAVSVVNPIVYDSGIFAGQSLILAPIMLGWRRQAVARELKARKGAILAAAILSPLAYFLVLQALTFSRLSYVSPTREIGIVFGTLLGARTLKEPYPANRLFGAALIVAGVFALAVSP